MNQEPTVAETIEMLEATIAVLRQKDPQARVVGHVAYPRSGYSGDLDGSIYKIDVEERIDCESDDEGNVVTLGVHYY